MIAGVKNAFTSHIVKQQKSENTLPAFTFTFPVPPLPNFLVQVFGKVYGLFKHIT